MLVTFTRTSFVERVGKLFNQIDRLKELRSALSSGNYWERGDECNVSDDRNNRGDYENARLYMAMPPARRGDSHITMTRMLVGNFNFTPKRDQFGRGSIFFFFTPKR